MDDLRFLDPEGLVNRSAFNERFEALNPILKGLIGGNGSFLGARIATGFYTGTGTYGSGKKNTISVGFKPKMLILRKNSVLGDGYADGGNDGWFFNSNVTQIEVTYADFNGTKGDKLHFSWEETSVSWYAESSALAQFNNGKYYYAILG